MDRRRVSGSWGAERDNQTCDGKRRKGRNRAGDKEQRQTGRCRLVKYRKGGSKEI